jgi:hypothetical protein
MVFHFNRLIRRKKTHTSELLLFLKRINILEYIYTIFYFTTYGGHLWSLLAY